MTDVTDAVRDEATAEDGGADSLADKLAPTLRAAAFGEIMAVLLQSPRHRDVTLGALTRSMVPPFLTKQYVIAKAKGDRDDAPATPVGVAFWARVSDEVDRRLQSEPDKPIELRHDEWQSGGNIWLLDVVAPPPVARSLVRDIRQRAGDGKPIKMKVSGADGRRRIEILNPEL